MGISAQLTSRDDAAVRVQVARDIRVSLDLASTAFQILLISLFFTLSLTTTHDVDV